MANQSLRPAAYVRYGHGKWWRGRIQSYAYLVNLLKGAELHQHHLIPKSLFLHGPGPTALLIDYVPSVTVEEREHLSAVHGALNEHLKKAGLWQQSLTSERLDLAIQLTANFYKERGLPHFAEAIDEFVRRFYKSRP